MLKSADNIQLEPFSEGMVSENIVSHYLAPKGIASYLENFHNDTLGFLTTRRMFDVLSTQPTATPLSCVLFTPTAGTGSGNASVAWQEGVVLKVQDILGTGSVISHPATFGASTKQRYDSVQGYLLMTNGGAQPRYHDGTTGTGATPPALGTSFPSTVDLISAGFSGRVWCADSTSTLNRLYYTDVIATVATITGGASYLSINANGGDKITGLARLQNVLYVFTNNGIFRVYNTQSQDNTPIAPVGAFSQEAIVGTKNGYYFYHPSGVYYLGSNGFPQEISGKIRDIIQKIPNANQSKVFGWADDDHVHFYVGNLPSLSVNKLYILRYTLSTQVWTIYTILMSPSTLILNCAATANFAATSITSNDIYPSTVVFASDGTNFYKSSFGIFNPSTVNSVVTNDFNALPIFVDVQTGWLDFELEHHQKRVSGIAVSHENGEGLKVAYQHDWNATNEWQEIGALRNNYVTLFRDFQSNRFNRIKFRVYGESKGVQIKIGKITVLSLDNLGYPVN